MSTESLPATVVDGVRTFAALVAMLAVMVLSAHVAATTAVATGNSWLTTGVEGRLLFVVAAGVGLAGSYVMLVEFYARVASE